MKDNKQVTPFVSAEKYLKCYNEGYAACVREIEKKLSKDNTFSFDSWKEGYTEGCTEFARLLKERTDDLYHKLEEREVWGINGDAVCHNCEDLVAKIIDTLLKDMTKNETTKKA